MHNFGAGDLLEIEPRRGGATVHVAVHGAAVPVVDIAAGESWSHRKTSDAVGSATESARIRDMDLMWRATRAHDLSRDVSRAARFSLAGKALATGLWALDAVDIRDHATDKHRTVDDTPAGGGPRHGDEGRRAGARDRRGGARATRPRLLMSPRGAPLTQARVAELAPGPGAIIVCGRFEGVDERVIEARGLEEVRIGDYVLSGGEIAALALIDACVRLLPGVMGKEASGAEESFAEGPARIPAIHPAAAVRGPAIPEVLTSGDHAKVAAWRRAEAERLTRDRRPDLWAAHLAAAGKREKARTRREQAPPGRVTKRRRCRRSSPIRTNRTECARYETAPPTENSHEFNSSSSSKSRSRSSPPARRSRISRPGDTVIVNVKVVEGERTRMQAYEGVCIARSGGGINESFTVRKISYGEGVERVFPLYSPMINSIKVVRRGKVRRAKLYYLRGLRGKKARITEKQDHATAQHRDRRRGRQAAKYRRRPPAGRIGGRAVARPLRFWRPPHSRSSRLRLRIVISPR